MAVARAGGLLTVTGVENDLRNLAVNAGSLAQGGTQILFGQNPVRRLMSLNSARIILSGHLKIDPEKETLIVASNAPNGSGAVGADGAGGAIEVRNGGHLEIGTSDATGTDGTTYSVGDAFVCARPGANASDIATAAMYGLPGSRVTLRGCALNTLAACRYDDAAGARAACALRITDVVWYNGRDRPTGYFAPRLYTSDYQIDGLRMVGGVLQIQARASASYIRNIAIERMQGGVGVTGNNFGALTDFFELRGVDGNHGSAIDVNVFNGMKARITNSRTGTAIKADLQARNHAGRSFGVIETRQRLRLRLKNAAGAAVPNARVHLEDVVAGRGNANWSAKNVGVNQGGSPSTGVNYTTQRTYSTASDAAGVAEFTADGGILTGAKVYDARPAPGATLPARPFAVRGKTAVLGDDLYDVHVHSYAYLGALLTVPLKGLADVELDVTLVADPSITEPNAATVAAYAGIAVDHATDTVTITAPFTLDQLYDYLKRDKTLPGSETHPTRAGMVAMADGTILDIGGYSLAVNAGGTLNPGAKFKSVASTATIAAAGTGRINVGYTDSTGKSLLVRLGAAQTAFVWDAGAAATYVAPSASATARILVPANATVNLTAKRVGHDYRKYRVAAADAAEIVVDLPRNPNVDVADVVDGVNLSHWRDAANAVYGGNAYIHKAAPNELRLGNTELTSRPAVTRALFDRRLTGQAGLEITHAHDDAARGRAYDVHPNRIRVDDGWLILARQPVTVPPNPAQGDGTGAGALWRISTWGLYVTRRDDVATYTPSRTAAYAVIVDPAITPFSPLPSELATAAESVADTVEFRDALAAAATATVRADLSTLGTDVYRVGAEVGRLAPGLFRTDVALHAIALPGGGTFGAYDPVTFAEDAGAWVWTWPADAPNVSRATGTGAAVSLNDDRDVFALNPPARARAVLQITLSARSDGPTDVVVDPGVRVQLDGANAAGESAEYALATPPSGGPVRLAAPVGDWGPDVVAEWDLPAFNGPANYDGMVIQTNAGGQGAVRVRVSQIRFIARTVPTLADFRADLTTLQGRLTAARAALLDNLDAAVSTRAVPADIPAAPDLSNLDVAVSTRLAAADYSAGGTQREVLLPAHVAGGHNPARASDAAFGGGGTYVDAAYSATAYAVWRVPSLRPDQAVRVRATIQVRRSDGRVVSGGFPMHGRTVGELWLGRDLDGTTTAVRHRACCSR